MSDNPKIHRIGPSHTGGVLYAFECPGCGYGHPFDVPRWTWNGSLSCPTFTPSLLCNKDDPKSRCHCVVTDGKIQFLDDCWHELRGKTVEMEDWDEGDGETS